MSNSDLYYIVHCSWNILFNVGLIAKTMEILCLGWLAGLHQGRTHKNPLSLALSWKSRCIKVKTPACTSWSWHTTSKHPEFLWRILERGMHPTFSINRKPSHVGWKENHNHAWTQLWTGLEIPNSCLQVQWISKDSCLAWTSMQILQESQTLGDPKVPFWQGLMWKGPHLNHIKRPVIVFSVTLAHLWAYWNKNSMMPCPCLTLLQESCKGGDI